MQIIVDKRVHGESVSLIGPFETADKAYDWIDRASKLTGKELGIDIFVHNNTKYLVRNLHQA